MESFTQNNPEQNMINGFSVDELKMFAGDNSEYYLKKWTAAENPAKRAGWNWAAFFLNILWMGYRKMYSYVFILLGLFLMSDIAGYISGMKFDRGISLGICIASGLLGNSFYFKHASRKLTILKNSSDNEEYTAKAAAAGDSSTVGVIISVLLLFAYGFITVLAEYLITGKC